MSVKLLTEHHLEILSLKGGCIGSSESTLVKRPHCWKSHVRAQISVTKKCHNHRPRHYRQTKNYMKAGVRRYTSPNKKMDKVILYFNDKIIALDTTAAATFVVGMGGSYILLVVKTFILILMS